MRGALSERRRAPAPEDEALEEMDKENAAMLDQVRTGFLAIAEPDKAGSQVRKQDFLQRRLRVSTVDDLPLGASRSGAAWPSDRTGDSDVGSRLSNSSGASLDFSPSDDPDEAQRSARGRPGGPPGAEPAVAQRKPSPRTRLFGDGELRQRGVSWAQGDADGPPKQGDGAASTPSDGDGREGVELKDAPEESTVMRLLRLAPPILMFFLVVAMSAIAASSRVKRPQPASPPSRVARLLENEAFHHVGVPVTNLSRSLEFYVGALGGRELDLGLPPDAPPPDPTALLASGGAGAPVPWQMVSFGRSQLMLWERPAAWAEATGGALRSPLALRMAHTVGAASVVAAVEEELRGRGTLAKGASGRCEETQAMQPHWTVVACTGPDGEPVQFWRPSVEVARAIERQYKDWTYYAADSRGRDIFE